MLCFCAQSDWPACSSVVRHVGQWYLCVARCGIGRLCLWLGGMPRRMQAFAVAQR